MLAPQVSSKIVSPLDPTISNIFTPRDWAIHTGVEVRRLVVSVEGLLGLEWAGVGAGGFQAGEFAGGAGVGAAVGGVECRIVWRSVVGVE